MQTIDGKWREHLLRLEHLRSVIGFRGYAQRDPLNEYKNESFQLFEGLLDGLRSEVTEKLSRIRPLSQEEQDEMMRQLLAQQQLAAAPAKAPQPAAQPAMVGAGGRRAAARTGDRRFCRIRPQHLGQSRPQRSLSLRVGQKVQTLPRKIGLIRRLAVCVAILSGAFLGRREGPGRNGLPQ